ncbi:MAG: bifunctional ornithine acetyltransferase/N-acetylglutamate synthase, partial [Cyanobium sp.]
SYLRACASGRYLGGPGPEGDTVMIRLQLGDGSGSGSAWGCDLSDQYVRINADYTT